MAPSIGDFRSGSAVELMKAGIQWLRGRNAPTKPVQLAQFVATFALVLLILAAIGHPVDGHDVDPLASWTTFVVVLVFMIRWSNTRGPAAR